MTSCSVWPCPTGLYVNDVVEVMATTGNFKMTGRVTEVRFGSYDTYVRLEETGGNSMYGSFSLPLSTNDYVWRKVRDVETLPCMKAAEVIYGATCRKCGETNEYAEAVRGFVCGSCRSWTT